MHTGQENKNYRGRGRKGREGERRRREVDSRHVSTTRMKS